MVHKEDLCSSVPMYTLVVHSVALYRLGGAQDDFACLLTTFLMVYNAVLSVSVFVWVCGTHVVHHCNGTAKRSEHWGIFI